MKKGDVVFIKFPFTDLSGSKLRPGLELVESGDDVVVAFIAGVLAERFTGDVSLIKSKQNGLKKDSVLRLAKLTTLSRI
jgi:mRNA interferase MazF